MSKTLKALLEARYVSSGAFRISQSGRKIRRRIKIGDDDYNKEDDIDKDGDVDKKDAKLAKRLRWESFSSFAESKVPERMQGKQKPYVSSDGKGNYEVLGNRGHTKATFTRAEHGSLAHGKAQAHLRAKYDEYMKEETEQIDEISQKLAGNYYGAATKKHIDKVGVKPNMYDRIEKDMGKQRKVGVDRAMDRLTGNRKTNEETQLDEKRGLWDNIHAKQERIKNGSGEKMRKPGSKGAPTAADFKASQSESYAPVAPVPDKKYIKGTPEHKAHKATKKPINGHPTMAKEETMVEHEEHGPDHVEIALDHRFPPKNQKTAMASLKAHGAEYVATSDKATHFKVHKDKAHSLRKELKSNGVESDINEGLKHHIAAAAIAVAGALGGHAHAQSNDTQKTVEKPAATASADSDKSPHDGGSKAEHQARIDKAVADGTMSRGDANVEKMKHGLRPSFGRVRLNQESKEDPPFDKPYKTVPAVTKDKSGAEHNAMSRARHLARLAMKQVAKKAKG